jgi:hypothetical protein
MLLPDHFVPHLSGICDSSRRIACNALELIYLGVNEASLHRKRLYEQREFTVRSVLPTSSATSMLSNLIYLIIQVSDVFRKGSHS